MRSPNKIEFREDIDTEINPEGQIVAHKKLGKKILKLLGIGQKPVPQFSTGQDEVPTERFHDPATPDEEALVEKMRSYRDRQKDTLRGERAQELREREFNARFTQLEELEMASEADGVSKRTEEYNGQKIPVYDLSGYPFRFLQHSVGFKDVPGQHQGAIGLNMARRLLNDPALWMRREPEITRDTAPSEQEANTVSASYVDTEINLAQGGVRDPYGVAYGFLSIRPDSCIGLFAGDSGTSNSAGHSRAEAIHLSRSPDALAEISTVFL